MTDDIRIREAQLDDQGKLGPLLLHVLGERLKEEHARAESAGLPTSPAEEELMAADDWYFSSIDLMNCCYFAWDGETPVGACVLNPYTAEIQYLAVLPEYRRRGIGTRLAEATFAECRRRGVDHLRIECLPEESSAAFLARLGFCEIRRVLQAGKKL